MTGKDKTNHTDEEISEWEKYAGDAVGNFIEFWGFKHNHGKVWTCLYLRGEPMSSAEIQRTLSLSKGAVSMITRELERWGVIHRVRIETSSSWHFVAEDDLMQMIGRVLKERESDMVARIETDLAKAEEIAKETPDVPEERIERLHRIHAISQKVGESIGTFIESGKIDLFKVADLMKHIQDFKSK